MAIFKRGNIWWVRFTAPNGQRIRRSTGTQDKQRAQEYHDHLKSNFWRIQKLGEKPKRSWQEAVKRWLQEKEHKSDIRKDVQKLRWLHSYLGGLELDQITSDLVQTIGLRKKNEASAATANRYLALLRSILRAARDDWEWLDKVPKVRLFSEPKKRVRFLTPIEASRLISELPPHLADLAAFSLATGLRQSNATELRWSQVDRSRCLAWIYPDQSKSRKSIAVPLNDDALQIIDKRFGIHEKLVFTYQGAPIQRTSTKAWYSALKRAGIDNFRWHDLRHTWASWHVQNGTSLQELQELGGWSSYEMVLRYAHLNASHLRKAANRISLKT